MITDAGPYLALVGAAARHHAAVGTGGDAVLLEHRVRNPTHPYYGVRCQDNPVTDFGAELNACIADCQAAGGGTVVVPGKIGTAQTIVLRSGVSLVAASPAHLRGATPTVGGATQSNLGGWLVWTGGTTGTVLQMGSDTQTDDAEDIAVYGLGIDGAGKTGVTGLKIYSNSPANPAYLTTHNRIERFQIWRCNEGIRWGSGRTEQSDFNEIAFGRIDTCPGGGLIVDANNAGDCGWVHNVKVISCGDATHPSIDFVRSGFLWFTNVAGGGMIGKDFMRMGSNTVQVVLQRCQSEKGQAFLRHQGSTYNEPVVLLSCSVDDPLIVEGSAVVVSFASRIKNVIRLSGAGAVYLGHADVMRETSGARVDRTAGAVWRNESYKRASSFAQYYQNETLFYTMAAATPLAGTVEQVCTRTGRLAAAWQANRAYAGSANRRWVAGTAYAAGDVVEPTVPSSIKFVCTVAGTSSTVFEPLWSFGDTVTPIPDGTATWAHNGASAVVPSAIVYVQPSVDNGHVYKLIQAGTSHATTEPIWPATAGATVADGGCVWQEAGASATFVSALGGAQAYTLTNHTADRALNEGADTVAQVANVLGTLIGDLQAAGIVR